MFSTYFSFLPRLKKKAGTAILIKNTVAFKLLNLIADPKGQYVILNFNLNSVIVRFK